MRLHFYRSGAEIAVPHDNIHQINRMYLHQKIYKYQKELRDAKIINITLVILV